MLTETHASIEWYSWPVLHAQEECDDLEVQELASKAHCLLEDMNMLTLHQQSTEALDSEPPPVAFEADKEMRPTDQPRCKVPAVFQEHSSDSASPSHEPPGEEPASVPGNDSMTTDSDSFCQEGPRLSEMQGTLALSDVHISIIDHGDVHEDGNTHTAAPMLTVEDLHDDVNINEVPNRTADGLYDDPSADAGPHQMAEAEASTINEHCGVHVDVEKAEHRAAMESFTHCSAFLFEVGLRCSQDVQQKPV